MLVIASTAASQRLFSTRFTEQDSLRYGKGDQTTTVRDI